MTLEPERRSCLVPFDFLVHYALTAFRRYRKLDVIGKLLLWGLLLFYVSMGTFLIVTGPGAVAQLFYDLGQRLSNLRFGWLIIGVTIIFICFPPLTGHSTLATVCGFTYGMRGFFLVAASSFIGSGFVFIILRRLFAKRLRRWTSTNEKWAALEAVVKAKGLPLIILIRMSPFPPWAYSNTLFASIEPVKLWQFLIATIFTFPKVLLVVFVGSRLASLSDGDQRREMDAQTKIINSCFAGGGVLLGITVPFVVYRLVQSHLRHLKGVSPEIDELAAEALEDADEGAPLLHNFSSDSVDELSEEHRRNSDIEV